MSLPDKFYERAGKIWDTMRTLDSVGSKISYLAAQFREVEREAAGIKSNNFWNEAYAKGFHAARERAAGIADRNAVSYEYGSTPQKKAQEVVELIRRMQP